jgi:hydrogenase expression/formation protein HypD
VTGFEPVDILQGICSCVHLLEKGDCCAVNAYERSVQMRGNRPALDCMRDVFKVVNREWRGIGRIESSGLELNDDYAALDAKQRFPVCNATAQENNGCISGLILQGKKKPDECPFFGRGCTPQTPIGAPMVSSEGACAAYYHYSRDPS